MNVRPAIAFILVGAVLCGCTPEHFAIDSTNVETESKPAAASREPSLDRPNPSLEDFREAVLVLESLNAKLEVGTTFAHYTQLLQETNSTISALLQKGALSTNETLRIQEIMSKYLDAHEYWRLSFEVPVTGNEGDRAMVIANNLDLKLKLVERYKSDLPQDASQDMDVILAIWMSAKEDASEARRQAFAKD